MSLAAWIGTLTLAVTLLAMLHPPVAHSETESCITGGAAEDIADNPELVADCDTLLKARDKLAGNARLNWAASTPFGQWEGIRWAGSPFRVTELNLNNRGLTGEVPGELGSLSSLVKLILFGNDLSGAIPAELATLPRLQVLILSSNELSGEIPGELASLYELRELSLNDNRLTGPISYQPGDFPHLIRLDLARNELSGNLPSWLASLAELKSLNLESNRFEGEILSSLGDLHSLEILDLTENQLTGEIPIELSKLSKLVALRLSNNQLMGLIPAELSRLSKLERLSMGNSLLSGRIPAELGQLSNLQTLFLPNNQLTGQIPVELGNLSNLLSLTLGLNQLTGNIPSSLGDLDKLERLELRQNLLTGIIPAELGKLSNLNSLWLSHNKLVGPIPPELGRLYNLDILTIRYNQLTGPIPRELGGLSELRVLQASMNRLSGEIPSSLGDLDNLERLEFRHNLLTGEIPPELGTLPNLAALHLTGNDMTGCIPIGLTRVRNFLVDRTGLRFCFAQHDGPTTVTPSTLLSVGEGQTLPIEESVLLANDIETENFELLVTMVGDAVNGTVRLDGSTVTYVHDGSETATGGFTYTVSDAVHTSMATVTIAVTPVNDAPETVDDTAAMDAGETLFIEAADLLSNDRDPEGDTLNVSAVSAAINGTVRLDGTTITYVHDGSDTTTGRFTYSASDGTDTATAMMTITVRPVNDPPVAVNDSTVMDEGGTLRIDNAELLSNDSDPDEDTLHVSAVGAATNGTVRLDGTTITFVHDGSETTTGAFTYAIGDGVDTATATVSIAVTPVNDPPSTVDDGAVMDEGGTLLIDTAKLLSNDSDAEEDTLHVSAVGAAVNGTVRLYGTTITYVHDGSETTTGGFVYAASDGEDTASAMVSITVTPVNDPPNTVDDGAVMDEGGTLLIDTAELLSNDSDAEEDTLHVSAVGAAVNGTVTLQETTITYMHDGSETTTGGFTYSVSDGVDTATAVVTISVRPLNDPPTAVDDGAVMDEGGTLLIDTAELLSNDRDPEDALRISAVGEPINGTLTLDQTTITFVHDGSETTTGAFTYGVSDGVDTATATVSIAVRPVNDPPVAVGDRFLMDEGETLQIQVPHLLANDSDAENATLKVSAVGGAVNGTVLLDGQRITYVHDGSETTTGGFTYTVSDSVDTATATVTITVRPVNDPPTAVGDTAVVDQGETLLLEESVLLFNDSDAEGESLSILAVRDAANGTVRMEGTTITYVHDGSETSMGGFAYIVGDGVTTATTTVKITVRLANDPPTAVDDTAVVDEGDTLVLKESVLLSNDSDAEGPLKVSGVGKAINGTVRMDGTAITYVHDGSETTSGGFTYVVSDGVDTATATVTITVRPVNDPPTASTDTATVDEGGTLEIQTPELLVNDSDAEGEALRISAIGEAESGTVRMDGTTITYVHDGSETTSGGFTYVVSDGVDTATATVTITVRPVNDPPTASTDTAAVDEGGTLEIQTPELLVNDSDAEGEALRISAVGEAESGTVRMDGTTITYVHDGSETTSDGFSYTVSDGVDTATATVTITVRPVNDFPAVPLILLAIGVALVTAVILAVVIALRRHRRVSQKT